MTLHPLIYTNTLNTARQCAVLLAQQPIGEALEAARRALEFGPFTDPTAWQRNHDKLAIDIRFLEAAAQLASCGSALLKAMEAQQEGER